MNEADAWECPKCKQTSGNDWTQCFKKCPLKQSPHYHEETAATFNFPVPYDEIKESVT